MKCQKPTVSVVIPCHNYGRYLADAVNSALAQTLGPSQIIVVNDGSTDETGAITGRYAGAVEYLPIPLSGVCEARNTGLRRVTGEFVIFLDADDILAPPYIEKTTALLRATDDLAVAFVYTQRESFGAEQGISKFPSYDTQILKQRNFIMVNALIRTDIARLIGYDPAYKLGLEDYDFFLTLAEKGYRGRLLDEPLVKVRVHGSSTTTSVNSTYRQIRLARQLIRKHARFYTVQEQQAALRVARQRMLLAIVQNRRLDRPMCQRVMDLFQLLRTRPGPQQLWTQFRYTFDPELSKPLFQMKQ